MARITFVQGDITTQEVDAVVNAANPSLMGGGGVDGAIHRAGGPSIRAECAALRRDRFPEGLPAGHAVTTTAGDLPCRWVIHTVGPRFGVDEPAAELLRACHEACLMQAETVGARSIAFPAISTGAYGYPPRLAAPVAVSAVSSAPGAIEEIRFVLFDAETLDIYRSAL